MAGSRGPAPPPIAFPKFCLAEDPDGLWVAEHGDAIVGFGFSWMTEKFWCLSQLFVRPKTQAKGIGQALLSKTLVQAERSGATNRALITFAYNIASTGLYLNNGLYPREPLYRVAAPAQAVARTPLAVFVSDPATGEVVGGLHGRSEFGLVYIAWFFLPEDLRRARIGSRVLAMAEEEGRRRGCTRIALTTLSVEAPGFYKKQGYDVAATIDCEPPGLTRYYMMKKL